jgi:hypothetical protein
MRIGIGSLAVAVAATGLLAAGPAAAEDFRWTGRLEAGQLLEIKGVNGDVEAEAASGDEIEVVAEKHARRDDPDAVRIEVVEHPGGVTLCAVYPDRRGRNVCAPGDQGKLGARDSDVQVEFRVRVPAGIRFAARTVNGAVSVRDLDADVEATTVNGGVRVETAGRAVARTVNGSIDARLGRADGAEPLSFETVNGRIEVELPEGASAEVDARTVNGSIDSDFPLEMRGRWTKKRASGSIGSGGRELELRTVNGSIRLRKR